MFRISVTSLEKFRRVIHKVSRFDTEERDAILGAKEWQHSIESVGGRYLVVSNFDGFREAVNDYFKEGIKF